MKTWVIIFRVIILIIGIIVIAFNAQLYVYSKQQRAELNSIKDKQDVESEFNSNKFKFEQDQIDHLSKDLEDTLRQIEAQKNALADQKDALIQEAGKRQQVENESKDVQLSLVDIKAETDAIKQDMKGWQKDYVGVLAQLEKGINNIQDQIKSLHENIDSLNMPELNQKINSLQAEVERIANPVPNDLTNKPPVPEKKTEHEHFESQ